MASQGFNSAVLTLLSFQSSQKVEMETENAAPEVNSPELNLAVVKKDQNSSARRTRSQTGAVRREAPKKTLNFLSKKSRVYGKNCVKKSRKRRRLKNGDVGVVANPKRRKVYDDEEEEKGLIEGLEVFFIFLDC